MKNKPEIRAAKELARNPYTWPGGYPKFAVMSDGECLCALCVKENFPLIARATRDGNADSWALSAVEINWEDKDITCTHCGKPIESAYGEDPENPQNSMGRPSCQ